LRFSFRFAVIIWHGCDTGKFCAADRGRRFHIHDRQRINPVPNATRSGFPPGLIGGNHGPCSLAPRCQLKANGRFLRKVIHRQAHDNYRVLLKDDGVEIELGSIGVQVEGWRWAIVTMLSYSSFRRILSLGL
jgi:hypothetical protein